MGMFVRLVLSTDYPEKLLHHAMMYVALTRYMDKIGLSKGKDCIYIEGEEEDRVTLENFYLMAKGMSHSIYIMKEVDKQDAGLQGFTNEAKEDLI
jgi:hypothetical protein